MIDPIETNPPKYPGLIAKDRIRRLRKTCGVSVQKHIIGAQKIPAHPTHTLLEFIL